MKLVVFSDVHGNAVALDAVLADISAQADTVIFRFPFDGDVRASYAVLSRSGSGWTPEIRRVPYDVERAGRRFLRIIRRATAGPP